MSKTLVKSVPPAPTPPPEGEKPVHTIRHGDVRGSIWKSETSDKTVFTVTVDHSRRDKAGNEEVCQVFGSFELNYLAKTVVECQHWIEWQERRLAASGRDVT
jgi:hypothetical protein